MSLRRKGLAVLVAVAVIGGSGWWWRSRALVLHVTYINWTTVVADDTLVGPVLLRRAPATHRVSLDMLSPTQRDELIAALEAMKAMKGTRRVGLTDTHYTISARWGMHRLSDKGRYSSAGIGRVLQALGEHPMP